MSSARLWYLVDAGCAAEGAAQVLARLRHAGLQMDAWQTGARGGGIIIFERTSAELRTFVQESTRGGSERVIAICLAPHADDVWELLQAGAADIVDGGEKDMPAAVAERFARWREIDRLIASPLVQRNMIGRSQAWLTALRETVEAARYSSAPILLTGESGTGKELLARLIHTLDPRKHDKDLIVVDCTTIVPELSGSEFFGHERGAFTGAIASRDGAFAQADGGTLFLDEIGELPLHLQAQLLRVVQEQVYKRVGGNSWHKTDFRLVCATHCDLRERVRMGQFRADLYFRIASVCCDVPPLRDRPDDIVPLFNYFFDDIGDERHQPAIDPHVRAYLTAREYPGNVRDLKQLATRVRYRHPGPGSITVGDLPPSERPAGPSTGNWDGEAFQMQIRRALLQGAGLKQISRASADTAVRIALQDAEGSVQRAAEMLQVTERALQLRRNGHHHDADAASTRDTATGANGRQARRSARHRVR